MYHIKQLGKQFIEYKVSYRWYTLNYNNHQSNSMKIEKIQTGKRRYMDLLLLGDEQESMIDRYLDRGDVFVMSNENEQAIGIGIAVVTDEGNEVCELKNIAVALEYQRNGYGREMIEHMCRIYCNRFSSMTVGTGDSIQTVSFYKNCGCMYTHSIPDFFIANYDHIIIEEGKPLKDTFCQVRRESNT